MLRLSAGESVMANLPYRSGSDAPERCTLDLYLPEHPESAPLLVWFHGGSLQGGHKADEFNRKVAEGFQAQGFAVVMVNYRLSPDVRFPVYVEDAAAAMAWALFRAADYGLDPARVFAGGHSAGGYLALLATLDPAYLAPYGVEASALAGIISLSAQTLTHSTVQQEQGLSSSRPRVDAAAPLHFADTTLPPLLLLCAENDVPARIEENQLLVALLRRRPENRITFRIIPDRDHMSILEKARNEEDPVLTALRSFMERRPETPETP